VKNRNIKEAAAEIGVSTDTLRYWEKEGIIHPKRAENGYRFYDDADMTNLKYLVVLKHARFSLADIKTISEAPYLSSYDECSQGYKDLINGKIAEHEQIIQSHQQIIDLLREGLLIAGGSSTHTEARNKLNSFFDQIFADIKSTDGKPTDSELAGNKEERTH